MSHALGIIFTKEQEPKILGYYVYDGTSDTVISHIYKTAQEVTDNWRESQWLKCYCKNDNAPISCYIYSSYGSGYYWEGKVCLKCQAFISGYEPEYTQEGRPDNKPTVYDIIMNKLDIEDYLPDVDWS